MTEAEVIVSICFVLFLGWIYYQLQKKIGLEQARDWEEFKKANPHLFRKPEPVNTKGTWTDEQKKVYKGDVGKV